MSDLAGQQFGNYRLMRLLGQGGFAETYLGEHIDLKAEAAVKIVQAQLAETEQEGFSSEARTIAQMKHPNIVRLLAFGVESSHNRPYLVMDYAPHGTLRQRHRRGEPVPIPMVLSYVKQLAAALQYAHEHKIIHRDVKPENMLVGESNEILLSDFGIAVLQSMHSQLAQNIAGTITYMAPEQIQSHPTAASDQYALAVAVYEWLCGVPPFNGSYTEIALQHEKAAPTPLRERVATIPFDVEQVVLIALSKEPQRRFGSVQAFATALEQAARVSPSSPLSLSADPQIYLPTERASQYNIPRIHTGYGTPPASSGMQPSYGSQLPPVENPYVPPPLSPVAQKPITPPPYQPAPSTPLSAASDAFLPRVTPQPSSHPQQMQPQSLPQTATGPARNPSQLRLSTTMIVVLAAVLVLIVGGSVFAYAGVYLPYQRQVQATAAVNAQLTGTARAHANATTTVRVQAAATQTARMEIYTQATSGTPIVSDPLKTPDNYGWSHTNDSAGQCNFVDGAYHAQVQMGNTYACYASATNFTDFAFQVEVTIISGSSGGIAFRVPTSGNFAGYFFYVNADGTYNVVKYTDGGNGNASTRTTLLGGSSSAIHSGLNQMNLVAVVARGNSFYFYVNKQYVNTVSDDSYKAGEIGISADSSGATSVTEAVFRNAQVWQAGTQTASGDLYNQVTGGTPALNDQLQAPDSNNWGDDHPDANGNCTYANGVFDVKAAGGFIETCLARATNFSNLAFQVEMRIVSGHSGGLVIRSGADGSGYYFRISTDGIFLGKGVAIKQNVAYYTPLFAGQSSAVNTAGDQFNQVTVIARGSDIYMYINQKFVARASDSTYQSGRIGVFTDSDASGAEILFRNAKVWKL
ncbi:MAG: protein kinase [Chloroflexi bacterium]|nr:protein kinase [Chloroflexota bacterium]